MAKYTLLVEGKDDQDFFRTYCKLIIEQHIVDVFPPKNLDSNSGDGWGNLIKNLPLLIDQLKNGDIDKLGIVLDADFPPDNSGGFDSRYKLVTEKLQSSGYVISDKPRHGKGDIFEHSDGLPEVGLWVMPDHQSNGMLENFIEAIITATEQQTLLTHATHTITNLPITLFDTI